jgi:hypothetical protein
VLKDKNIYRDPGVADCTVRGSTQKPYFWKMRNEILTVKFLHENKIKTGNSDFDEYLIIKFFGQGQKDLTA